MEIPTPRSVRTRYRVFLVVLLLVGALLAGRLAQLQLLDRAAYAAEARGNALREQILLPPRGRMFDRHGRLLVADADAFAVTVVPYRFDAAKTGALAGLLGLPDSLVEARVRQARRYNPYAESPIARGLTVERVAPLEEKLFRFSGVRIEEEQRRSYPDSVRAPFVYGTVGEIGAAELARRRSEDERYRLGDVVGLSGMEEAYQDELRGRPGVAYQEVDVRGRVVGSWLGGREDVAPVSGYDLTLGLDAGLQAFAESLFVDKRGAAVALDPHTGEVLAFVSAPDYDPRLLVPPIDPDVWRALNADPARPLYDRAALSAQPTGSTIKPFMGLLGLETGTITKASAIDCPGAYVYGGHVFHDDAVHGHVDLQNAIRVSCNVYFFRLMMMVPYSEWVDWGHLFGFGVPIPTDLPNTAQGLWPDSAYFDRTYGAWTPGYLVSLGIGQGNIGVTPLQLARYAAALANGGTLVAPHFARSLRNPDTGAVVLPGVPRPVHLPISPEHMETIRQAMRMVVESGTGRSVALDAIAMAGKTGTAQNPHGEDHALFIAFAPYDDPQIAVAVLVENAGFGAVAAAPIASLMIERYLTGGIAEDRQPLLQRVLTSVRSEPIR